MAELELRGEPLTSAQLAFLNQMLTRNTSGMCGAPPYIGWYTKLFSSWDNCNLSRPCIADVHTIPPSVLSPSNMVLHAATGDTSFVIIQAATGNECGTLYVGAVSSLYQHDETPIKRLADSEWKTMLQGSEKPGVPAWFGKYVKQEPEVRTQEPGEGSGMVVEHCIIRLLLIFRHSEASLQGRKE